LKEIDEHLGFVYTPVGAYDAQHANVILKIGLMPDGVRLTGPRPVMVGGKIMESRVIQRVPPVYPQNARTARVQGTVELGVTIGPDGRVLNVQQISGPAMLVMAAMDAVAQWVYEPFKLNGNPVAVQTTVVVNFVLQ
jgi:bla regulator protein blaR1